MPARSRRTLAKMIEHGFVSSARCPTCGVIRTVDLAALMLRVGPEYSLWNRRMRCKFTEGCTGWIRFRVGPGWPAPDYDERTDMRWMQQEWEEQLAREAGAAGVEKTRRR